MHINVDTYFYNIISTCIPDYWYLKLQVNNISVVVGKLGSCTMYKIKSNTYYMVLYVCGLFYIRLHDTRGGPKVLT